MHGKIDMIMKTHVTHHYTLITVFSAGIPALTTIDCILFGTLHTLRIYRQMDEQARLFKYFHTDAA